MEFRELMALDRAHYNKPVIETFYMSALCLPFGCIGLYNINHCYCNGPSNSFRWVTESNKLSFHINITLLIILTTTATKSFVINVFVIQTTTYLLRLKSSCPCCRLRSSCPCWDTVRRVVSIGHGRWQHFWFHHECHCHWHPLLSCLPWTCPATSALACPNFCILPLESSLLLGWLVLTSGGVVHAQWIFFAWLPQCPVDLQRRLLVEVLRLS